jgi:hypothetical protein
MSSRCSAPDPGLGSADVLAKGNPDVPRGRVMKTRRLATLAVLGLVGLFVLSGCAQHLRGAGAIRSLTPGKLALFAFVFDAPEKRFKGVFYDPAQNIAFQTNALVSYTDIPGVRDECMQAVGRYHSKVKGKPGKGQVEIVACDNGNPGRDPTRPKDQLGVRVIDGPLAGYTNGGELVYGNLTASDRPLKLPDYDDKYDHEDDKPHKPRR